MDNNFVTTARLESARENSGYLRNLLACMELAVANPDPVYHAVAWELFPLAFSLCDEVNVSLSDLTKKETEASA